MSTLALALLLACGPTTNAAKQQRIDREYAAWERAFPAVPTVDAVAAASSVERGDAVLIDARTDAERAVSRLPGSIDRETYDADRSAYPGPVIAYCTIGARSGRYASELRSDGVDAANLHGGLLGWTHAGQPLVDPTGSKTHRAHVYARPWNLLPNDYEAVW